MSVRTAFLALVVGALCLAARAAAAGPEADPKKRCRDAFAPLKLPSAAKVEKDVEPELPQGIVTDAGPFDALVKKLLQPLDAQLAARDDALRAAAAAPAPDVADAVAAGLRALEAEHDDLAARVAKVEASYAEVWDAGYMESGEKQRRARKSSAVLIPFYRTLMARGAEAARGAEQALGAMSSDADLAWLTDRGARDASAVVRTAVAAALGRTGKPAAREALARMVVADASSAVRSQALAALCAWKITEMKDVAIAALSDAAWEVRAFAVAVCARANLAEAAGPLVEAIAREDGRLRQDIDDALHTLVGVRYYGDADLWRKWWADNAAAVAKKAAEIAATGAYDKPLGAVESWDQAADAPGTSGPEAGKPKGVTSAFYGIETASRRVLYLVDISLSMADPAKDVPTVTGVPRDPYPAPAGRTKIDVARWQLHRAVEALPPGATFNVVVYSESYKPWTERMTEASPKSKAKAHEFIDALKPNGTTNICDPVDEAFEIAGRPLLGPPRKGAPPELAVDTVFLLSDGNPNRGRLSALDALLETVVARNRAARIVFHTVGIGEVAGSAFLKDLARRTGGRYVGFE